MEGEHPAVADALEQKRERLERKCREYGIPDYMVPHVVGYILHGQPPDPDDFLFAALTRDIVRMAQRADDNNRRCLWPWAMVLSELVPTDASSSAEKIRQWVELGGFRGLWRRQVEAEEGERDARDSGEASETNG
jgi:hypothetical protein